MTFETWVSIVGLIFIPIIIWYLHFQLSKSEKAAAKLERENDEKEAANDAAHGELRKYCERLNNELYNMRLDMANSFVSNQTMRELENRFIKTVERIDIKLDRMSEEIFRRKD